MFAVNVSVLVNLGILWCASATILGLVTGPILARATETTGSTDAHGQQSTDAYGQQPHIAA